MVPQVAYCDFFFRDTIIHHDRVFKNAAETDDRKFLQKTTEIFEQGGTQAMTGNL